MRVDIKKKGIFLVILFFCFHDCVRCMGYGRIWHDATEVQKTILKQRRADLGVVLGHPEAALGNLLCVDAHPDANLVGVVYCSGNTPYSVEPPDATLSRRTMLNILLTNSQAADLTYGHRIRSLPESFALDAMIVEALESNISDEFRTILEEFTARAWNLVFLEQK